MPAETATEIAIDRADRSFLVEYQPEQPAAGWYLRERHHDGWPVMAGPYPTADDAAAGIEDLLTAGPLACFEDEHGIQSCFV